MLRRGSKASERRRHLSDRLSCQQDQALSSSIYLLREIGPTGFLLREEEPENKDFRVFLGNPHVCNCSTFQKGGELCKHICWILLKKFKLPRNHESALQLGLMEGEISDLLRGIYRVQTPQKGTDDDNVHIEEDGYIKQKEIDSDDICPICQEALLEKKLPVTFCRFGCGNSIHIKCMKILANYQDTISNTSMLKCPLCRKEFAPLKLILEEFKNSSKLVTSAEKERLDKHLGIPCNNCKQFPIEGKCYKCTQCIEFHLCQECFDSCCHHCHPFTFREKRNQRWKSLEKRSDELVKYIDVKNEIEEKMPHFQEKQGQVHTPKPVVKSLPLLLITKNSKLLAPGYQCRLCLKEFCLGQYTRLLPCSHKFHRKCIDSWLFHKCNSCPVDGQVIYNPLIWKDTAVNGHIHQSVSNTDTIHLSKQEEPGLFIPGTGLILKQNRPGILPSIPHHNSEKLNTPQSSTDTYQNKTTDDLCSINLDDSNSRKLIYEYKISQHFPRYLQDLPTGSFGKISSQTFLPSIAHKNIICPTGMESPCINENYHTDQSQKMTKGCKPINHNQKKILGTKIREENSRSNTLLPEDLNLIVNWGTTKLSLSKRYNNCMGKIRQKNSHLSRRPISHPLNTKTELSLILKGVQL
ncbi:E3 ubiquitin-protein ligase ZSWIM2 [Rousettus aegyptiacus]|uniref:RING-type E3 ubiquitin transferase n=2 Tax=Rousettus aegyptiacus TaxID=9407 RepID=A0A7J8JQI8_ROUAE|nr:E3 ubiquitin-protein ligase ZSWIM2 [Rousettus aegyptiacus]KAF6498710.1 zinc finger SWIM-type containing 2 [Rousettus aegyptiacus]